ncbi:MAG TPA: hypothetical protein VIH90_00030 [Candidatus Saccharimonadales bacterium]
MNSSENISEKIQKLFAACYKFRYLIFIVFILVIYLFLVIKAATLSHVQPSISVVKSQSSTYNSPEINPQIVNKINQLQNNSVSVNALFNQARQNPFQE